MPGQVQPGLGQRPLADLELAELVSEDPEHLVLEVALGLGDQRALDLRLEVDVALPRAPGAAGLLGLQPLDRAVEARVAVGAERERALAVDADVREPLDAELDAGDEAGGDRAGRGAGAGRRDVLLLGLPERGAGDVRAGQLQRGVGLRAHRAAGAEARRDERGQRDLQAVRAEVRRLAEMRVERLGEIAAGGRDLAVERVLAELQRLDDDRLVGVVLLLLLAAGRRGRRDRGRGSGPTAPGRTRSAAARPPRRHRAPNS